jgi:hypothetical protein
MCYLDLVPALPVEESALFTAGDWTGRPIDI